LAPNVDKMGLRVHRKKIFLVQVAGFAIAMGGALCAQEPSLARLNHEADADIPRASIVTTWSAPRSTPPRRALVLPESAIARPAAQALFVDSDLERARALALEVLRRDPNNAEALFLRMEVAAMAADNGVLLDTAVHLCEAGREANSDPRVRLAAARIREEAANTPAFRAIVPRIKSLLANSSDGWLDLEAALLAAAMDGVPGLNPYSISHAAGILTDWRIVGPVRKRPLADEEGVSRAGDLSAAMYQNRMVEDFRFPDGQVVLPDYLPHHGAFYGAAHFSSLTAATWRLDVESGGEAEIYVDGRRVSRAGNTRGHHVSTFEATPGPHRVLVAFSAQASPLRIAITPANDDVRPQLPSRISAQELTYLLAADHYARGEFDSAAKQIDAIPSSQTSAALQFLLAQTATRRPSSASALNGNGLDEESLLIRRMAVHPSCATLHEAMNFYQGRGDTAKATSVQQQLNGCAPESLDYAQSLSEEGRHAESAEALRALIAIAPLNREARLMLVRELQMAGEDEAAQRSAAAWLHVAPNAESYHRLAATVEPEEGTPEEQTGEAFYDPYRRDASEIVHEGPPEPFAGMSLLMEDHVAIARPDGSVSLYVHTVKRLPSDQAAQAEIGAPPPGSQVLTRRILHSDETSDGIDHIAQPATGTTAPGDALEEEYVINYAGDGGISEHCEAFQFVFGSAGEQTLHARFVVLTPAEYADRGVVIATGGVPHMTATLRDGMVERVWEEEGSENNANPADASAGSPIVRVVEEENGWATPSSAEHQRRIETIHPGPRPEES
jgi:tetratricopeptide (TPR) repeat protein